VKWLFKKCFVIRFPLDDDIYVSRKFESRLAQASLQDSQKRRVVSVFLLSFHPDLWYEKTVLRGNVGN